MENINRYNLEDIYRIILTHHHKHLPFNRKKHNFVIRSSKGGEELEIEVITTVKEVKKGSWKFWKQSINCTK